MPGCATGRPSSTNHDIPLFPAVYGRRLSVAGAAVLDWFGDWTSRLGLVRFRGCGRFGGWLVLVWEPRDFAVSGLIRIASICRIACFRGLIRESNPEIGFGPRRTLESMCARLCDWSAVIKEPWYSAVSSWLRFAGACCDGRPCGLDWESDVETRSSPRRGCGRC